MSGLIAQKISMTQITRGDALVSVTLLRVPATTVAQVKTSEKDGYDALVIESKKTNGKTLKKKEFSVGQESLNVGDTLSVEALDGIESVQLTAISKGRGFTGAMKRWNFK